jgi:hypothetical protein
MHSDGTNRGRVFFPFASKQFRLINQPTTSEPNMSELDRLKEAKIIFVSVGIHGKPVVTFIPDTSQWSNHYIVIGGTFESFVLDNPTAHTIGTPLFFEYINTNMDSNPVSVRFDTKYVAGG